MLREIRFDYQNINNKAFFDIAEVGKVYRGNGKSVIGIDEVATHVYMIEFEDGSYMQIDGREVQVYGEAK